jgi:hypothetical protein
LALRLISVSASEVACRFKVGVAGFDRISSFRGDDGENGGSRLGTLDVVSASSGMVSLERGRVVLLELRVEGLFGGIALLGLTAGADDFVDAGLVAVAVVRVLVGVVEVAELVALVRDDSVEGLLGGADVVKLLPSAVLLVFSPLGSTLAVRELKEEDVGVRTPRFSSPFAATSLGLVLVVLRTEETIGRVGGFVMVLPLVRDESALLVLGLDVEELRRAESAACFFASSTVVRVGFLSIVKTSGGIRWIVISD